MPTRVPTRRAPVPAAGLFAGLPAKRATLFQAALDLFVERGFEATSVPEVARRARMATGTIYLHFTSTEELVNALLAHVRGRLIAALQRAVDPSAAVRTQFDAIWDVFAGHVLEHPHAVAFCDLHHHAPYLTPETQAAWEPARRLLEAHFRAGIQARVYRDLPSAALRALFAGGLLGLAKFARLGELTLSRALLDASREAVWAGLSRPKGGRA